MRTFCLTLYFQQNERYMSHKQWGNAYYPYLFNNKTNQNNAISSSTQLFEGSISFNILFLEVIKFLIVNALF